MLAQFNPEALNGLKDEKSRKKFWRKRKKKLEKEFFGGQSLEIKRFCREAFMLELFEVVERLKVIIILIKIV